MTNVSKEVNLRILYKAVKDKIGVWKGTCEDWCIFNDQGGCRLWDYKPTKDDGSDEYVQQPLYKKIFGDNL